MILDITDKGAVIPKKLLAHYQQIEIKRRKNYLIIRPVINDSLNNFGKHPVELEINDDSINHDKYIY